MKTALPCPALPCPALPCPALPCPALPCPALPCPALPCPPCPALPCPALPCPALPCPALPCPALPCPALPCPALPRLPDLAAATSAMWLEMGSCGDKPGRISSAATNWVIASSALCRFKMFSDNKTNLARRGEHH
jgi:hypothetical protein